jgi:ATP-dependent DNA helicase PIF1
MKRAAEEPLEEEEEVKKPRLVQESGLSPSQELALKAALEGRNIFITGNAGSGKSFLLARIMEELAKQRRTYALTASTGVAAWNIGGVTLHSFAGIGWNGSAEHELAELQKKKKHKIKEWQLVQVLIIDEVSMMKPDFMRTLDTVVRQIRGKVNQPFGGVQLILTGDYFQCPPVYDKNEKPEHRFLFDSPLWKEWSIKTIGLRENFRQAGDLEFFSLLERAKRGALGEGDKLALEQRLLSQHPEIDESQLIKLCSTRATAESFNRTALAKLEGQSRRFFAKKVKFGENGKPQEEKEEDTGTKEKFPVPLELELKVGAQVLLCFNMETQAGLFNGSRGTVVDFRSVDQLPHSPQYPLVKFENGCVKLIEPHVWEVKKGQRLLQTYTQVPLILRYAITIHKAQGLTLKDVLVTMDFFVEGQGYVALSRVPSLEDLFVTRVDLSTVTVAPEVLAFYKKHKLIEE